MTTTIRECHCGAPSVTIGLNLSDLCIPCLAKWQGAGEPETCPCNNTRIEWPDCLCYLDCGEDSLTHHWHQHVDEPCSVHSHVEVVG